MVRNKLRKFYKGLSVALIISMTLGGGLHLSASSTTRDELNNAQQEANRVQQQINENKNNLNKLENEKNNIAGQLSNYNVQLSEAVNELNDTEFAIAAKELEIENKLRELDTAQQIEEQQYDDLMAHLQYMYESGVTQSYLNLLSSATSLTEFLNLSEYVEQISAYDVSMLKQFKAVREYIEAEEAVLEQEREELQVLRDEQERKRQEVHALVDQTQTALNNKKGEITAKENEVTAQEEQLATIKDNIKELQKKLADELRLSQEAANAEWRDISQVEFEPDDLRLLANLIYCEARGESYEGKLAVASVVVNRILSSKFPNTMTGVIYQKNQFAPVTSTKNSFVEAFAHDKASWPGGAGCYEAAQEAMSGMTNVDNCVFFQTLAYIEKLGKLDVVRYSIGNHGFY